MTTEAISMTFLAEGEELVNRKLYNVPLSQLITDPDQPRKFFDEVAMGELKSSIEKHGILQPVIFRRDEQGRLVVVSGERRFRASELAGQESIPALFNEGGNSAEIALVENLLRENLTPIEEAEALQRLKDEQSYNQEQLSSVIGKAVSTISEILSLNKLPEDVKEECRANTSYSRRALVEIAKGDDHETMRGLFAKYKTMELKRDGVRAARQSGSPRLIDWVKTLEGFRKRLNGLDLDQIPGKRTELKKEIDLLVTALRAKLKGEK